MNHELNHRFIHKTNHENASSENASHELNCFLRRHLSNACVLMVLSFFSLSSQAHIPAEGNAAYQPALATLSELKMLGIPVFAADSSLDLGFAYLTPEMQQKLQASSHHNGKCGGFEVIPEKEINLQKIFSQVRNQIQKYNQIRSLPLRPLTFEKKNEVERSLSMIQETQIQETVQWLSSFKNRIETKPTANEHVVQLKSKVEEILKYRKAPWTVELINHQNTRQQSLKVTLPGQKRPQEIIVLGGHHDSVNSSWGGGSRDLAPGADDNASGSANLLEILRAIAEEPALDRTIEIMWYAAEESGLVGSGEIAKNYKNQNKDVVAVVQLDMTSFPGSGEMTIANVTDYTSPWLQNILKAVNDTYLQLQIVDDQCGYACSDHASWFRQGYPTVVPFESRTNQMNRRIHTTQDVLSPVLSFKHSAAIAKLTLALAYELGNSELRQPK